MTWASETWTAIIHNPTSTLPHLTELAAHGLQFAQHYSGSTVSAPSRCCLLTGKHTGHAHVRGNKSDSTPQGRFDLALPAREITVAEVLKRKGYATMCVGKWGLGGPGTEGSPLAQGFDYFFGYLGQGDAHRYYPECLYENERRVSLGGRVYSHWVILEKGLDFIRHCAPGQPFFAYFAFTLPHADLDHPDLRACSGRFREEPYVNRDGKGGFKTQMQPKAAYASMVAELDRSVGEIIRLLKERGEWENTLLVFSSDNGVHRVGGHDPDFFDSNGPFRGCKRDLYEGGVRTFPRLLAPAYPHTAGAPARSRLLGLPAHRVRRGGRGGARRRGWLVLSARSPGRGRQAAGARSENDDPRIYLGMCSHANRNLAGRCPAATSDELRATSGCALKD